MLIVVLMVVWRAGIRLIMIESGLKDAGGIFGGRKVPGSAVTKVGHSVH